MSAVEILTADEARRRADHEVPWCTCEITRVCTCGREAPVRRIPQHEQVHATGWEVES